MPYGMVKGPDSDLPRKCVFNWCYYSSRLNDQLTEILQRNRLDGAGLVPAPKSCRNQLLTACETPAAAGVSLSCLVFAGQLGIHSRKKTLWISPLRFIGSGRSRRQDLLVAHTAGNHWLNLGFHVQHHVAEFHDIFAS